MSSEPPLQSMRNAAWSLALERIEDIDRISRDGPRDDEYDRLLVLAVFKTVLGTLIELGHGDRKPQRWSDAE